MHFCHLMASLALQRNSRSFLSHSFATSKHSVSAWDLCPFSPSLQVGLMKAKCHVFSWEKRPQRVLPLHTVYPWSIRWSSRSVGSTYCSPAWHSSPNRSKSLWKVHLCRAHLAATFASAHQSAPSSFWWIGLCQRFAVLTVCFPF